MRNKRVSIVLTELEKKQLKKLSRIADRSQAEVIRALIRRAANQAGLADPAQPNPPQSARSDTPN